MRRIVITGGPGAGKTTLVAALSKRGFTTVAESARQVIAERLARGETPRPSPEAFAREILRRDVEKYFAQPANSELVFYDRNVIEAIAMLHEATPLPEPELQGPLATYPFFKTVFALPPWEAIYRTDTERDHSFAHSERVYHELVRWYRSCGYAVHHVPRAPVEQRAKHVLHVLAGAA
jgi:predicted ATPase